MKKAILFLFMMGFLYAADCDCNGDEVVQFTDYYIRIKVYEKRCRWEYVARTVAQTSGNPCEENKLKVSVTVGDAERTSTTRWQNSWSVRYTSTAKAYDHRSGTREISGSSSHYAGHCSTDVTESDEASATLKACCP